MSEQRLIEVWADWRGLAGATLMGRLSATLSRGKEIFSFEYDTAWLQSHERAQLDPTLAFYGGPQYPSQSRQNFGVFLDSSPDRWGRVLMRRREAQLARAEDREEELLLESDYLLGVHDRHRMGALRFRVDGRFLDDNTDLASPPWTSLRDLQHASLQLERDDAVSDSDYGHWLRLLIAPGGSLGGARPKASVLDEKGHLWIAKFPSRRDDQDVGAWESVVHELASRAGLCVPDTKLHRFGSSSHTFLSRRFDRTSDGERLHFASAMTLLEREDGDDANEGVSYLELAELLMRAGAQTSPDLEELWRRIVFFACVSNTDDHLRNHGFLLNQNGWTLAPAYDMNPNPHGDGLKLNISETDNAQDFDLIRAAAEDFRVRAKTAERIINDVATAVRSWRQVANDHRLSTEAQDQMRRAFRLVENPSTT